MTPARARLPLPIFHSSPLLASAQHGGPPEPAAGVAEPGVDLHGWGEQKDQILSHKTEWVGAADQFGRTTKISIAR